MNISQLLKVSSPFLLMVITMPQARAQWAVVDQPAIVQLVHQVQTMEQELQTTRSQLAQAKEALQTMTGDRGMQRLLGGTVRNYLPTTWTQLESAAQGGNPSFPGLAADVRSVFIANTLLTPAQLAQLAPATQQQINAGRQTSALRQALASESLVNVSGRFTALQSLIDGIGAASDQKSILDLQARILAELGMLQNEQTKTLILRQAADAQEAVNVQQQRELTIAAQGSFATRFQPVP